MGQPKPGPMLDGARAPDLQGRQGPGAGQAGAGDRRGRRPQPALRRAAGLGEVDAGAAPARPAAAALGRGAAADLDGALDGRPDRQGRAHPHPAVPRPRTTPPAWPPSPAAASAPSRARSRWRTTACCSWTNSRNSSPQALDSLRQPLETGEVMVARANYHIRYPAKVQLVAAQNPCRCGRWRPRSRPLRQGPALPAGLSVAASRVRCSTASTSPSTFRRSPPPTSPCRRRPRAPPRSPPGSPRRRESRPTARSSTATGSPGLNARAEGAWLETHRRPRRPRRRAAGPGRRGRRASRARGWSRTLRLARTIADLEGAGGVRRVHIAEALIYRRIIARPPRAWASAA